jgi:two-component system sensor histidine kinase HydH
MGTGRSNQARSMPEALIRTLRHEVGDLLQTVYATVAILQRRLAKDQELEQRVLTDMRGRAETCRRFLDMVHDLVCPVVLAEETVDLTETVRAAVASVRARRPEPRIDVESSGVVTVAGDGERLAQVADQLLTHACELAGRVVVRVESSPGQQILWTISDDGPSLTPEQQEKVFTVFYTTRQGRPGAGLALAKKLVEQHGGTIVAQSEPGGGLCVRISLPVARQTSAP